MKLPVAKANATVPESAPKATPLDIQYEIPPMMIDQSSTVYHLKLYESHLS